MAYQIEFAESVKTHLQVLTVGQRATVLDAIERHLANEPLVGIGSRSGRTPLRLGNYVSERCVCSTM